MTRLRVATQSVSKQLVLLGLWPAWMRGRGQQPGELPVRLVWRQCEQPGELQVRVLLLLKLRLREHHSDRGAAAESLTLELQSQPVRLPQLSV